MRWEGWEKGRGDDKGKDKENPPDGVPGGFGWSGGDGVGRDLA